MNPMGLSAPWAASLNIIAQNPVRKLIGNNPTALMFPWAGYIDIIALQTVKNGKELTQWDLVPIGTTLLILLP